MLAVPALLAILFDRPPARFGGVALVLAAMGKWVVVQDAVNHIGRQKDIGGIIAPAGGVSRIGGIIAGLLTALAVLSAIVAVARSS